MKDKLTELRIEADRLFSFLQGKYPTREEEVDAYFEGARVHFRKIEKMIVSMRDD